MAYSLTIFNSIYDVKTHRRMNFKTWDEFEELLYALSRKDGYKPKRNEKKPGSPLITPAVFKEGTTRLNENVIEWASWACLDIDTYDCSFEETLEAFRVNRFVCYSTSSSSEEKPKFRVVLPLTAPVPADKIRHFWYALNKQFKSVGDPQTKDLSRMYYIPAVYPDSYQFIFSHKDAPMIDPTELMSNHPYSDGAKKSKFSAAMQEKMVAYKKEKLTNTSFKWTSYHDCPFVNKTLVAEYRSITETGWYSTMFRIMTSIASTAMRRGYPITPHEIASLCSELDAETGCWYKNRPLEMESSRAIEFACKGL